MSREWYFIKDGKSCGPLSDEGLLESLTKGTITGETVVWTKELGTEWKPLRATSLANAVVATPPPIPTRHVSNAYVWTMVAIPVVGVFIELAICGRGRFVPTWGDQSYIGVLISYLVAYSGLAIMDGSMLKKAGYGNEWAWVLLFVPIYLFRRAWLLRGTYAYAWMFIVSLLSSGLIIALTW